MEKIGIGIIGCGARIKDLFLLYPKFLENLKILGVFDTKIEASEEYKRLFDYEMQIYKDYTSLIKNPDIKWIFIGSINSAHKDQIIACFNENKHVFCEKPLAISIKECKEIKEVYDKKNLNFFIGYVLRYSKHYLKIKEIIDSGKIGKIISMDFNETIPFNHGVFFMSDWRRFLNLSGGFLLEKCCHDMDLANWIIRSIPEKICSFGGRDFFKKENSYFFEEISKNSTISFDNKLILKNPFLLNNEITDNQVVILEYKNGVRASFHLNANSSIPERRMYICGEKGSIRADLLKGLIELNLTYPEKYEEIFESREKESHGGGDILFLKDIEEAILNYKNINMMDEAIKSAVTCILIDKSMKECRIIDANPIWEEFNF